MLGVKRSSRNSKLGFLKFVINVRDLPKILSKKNVPMNPSCWEGIFRRQSYTRLSSFAAMAFRRKNCLKAGESPYVNSERPREASSADSGSQIRSNRLKQSDTQGLTLRRSGVHTC